MAEATAGSPPALFLILPNFSPVNFSGFSVPPASGLFSFIRWMVVCKEPRNQITKTKKSLSNKNQKSSEGVLRTGIKKIQIGINTLLFRISSFEFVILIFIQQVAEKPRLQAAQKDPEARRAKIGERRRTHSTLQRDD